MQAISRLLLISLLTCPSYSRVSAQPDGNGVIADIAVKGKIGPYLYVPRLRTALAALGIDYDAVVRDQSTEACPTGPSTDLVLNLLKNNRPLRVDDPIIKSIQVKAGSAK